MRPCGFPIMLQQGPETYILFLYNLDYSSSSQIGVRVPLGVHWSTAGGTKKAFKEKL